MFVLPVSRVAVTFRVPDGHDEIALAEGSSHSLWLGVEAVRRLAPPVDSTVDWSTLPYADVDAALLGFREQMYGDRMIVEVRCTRCAAWGDTTISVREYLHARRPQRMRNLSTDNDGWWTWRDIRFRPPTVAAVLDAVSASGATRSAADELIRFCCETTAPAVQAHVTRLLNRLATPLAGVITGHCPECGAVVDGWFDPGAFVLSELQSRAAVVFDHVHLLAQAYGWAEAEILGLPVRRRVAYASRVERERVQ